VLMGSAAGNGGRRDTFELIHGPGFVFLGAVAENDYGCQR
jgi:hypothetical protein